MLQPLRVWSREPDAWDVLWEQEELARRAKQNPDAAAQRQALAQEAVERAAARAEAEARHQRLLERQQRRDALRDRLREDAQRAKQEQLRRIEVGMAESRARTQALLVHACVLTCMHVGCMHAVQ